VAVRAEFGRLGPIVVRCEGAVVHVAGGRQSALLAALLLDADHPVTIGQLLGRRAIDDIGPGPVRTRCSAWL
jgi:hypothetical protein